jgi:SAM-dependent methyltransferase
MKNALIDAIPERSRPHLRRAAKKVRHFGLRYRCPFCNSNLHCFLPFGLSLPVLREKCVIGGGIRPNARCPVCASIDRERLVWVYLRNRANITSRRCRLLHVAPEGVLRRKLQELANLDYLSADLYATDVMVKMDITDIQFPADEFDAIICNHVLEHVVDDRRAMSELYRVLKPGGWAILQVPISEVLEATYEDFSIVDPSAREQAFGQEDHVRLYARDYPNRLREAGFDVRPFEWWKEPADFGGPENRFGLLPRETLYVGFKPARDYTPFP